MDTQQRAQKKKKAIGMRLDAHHHNSSLQPASQSQKG
jgi:hypothetical protein